MVVASPQLLDVHVADTCESSNSVEDDVGTGLAPFDAWDACEVVEEDSGVLPSCCVG